MPVDFTPQSNPDEGQLCHGVQIFLVDRQALNAPELGIELASALYGLFPKDFKLDQTLPLIGSQWVISDIREGVDPKRIEYLWQEQLAKFRTLRSRYLLY